MKISDILFESDINPNWAKIETILAMDSEFPGSYSKLEKILNDIKESIIKNPDVVNPYQAVILILITLLDDYLSLSLWANLEDDPTAEELKSKIQNLKEDSLKILNSLIQKTNK